jgi:hypothetical protein
VKRVTAGVAALVIAAICIIAYLHARHRREAAKPPAPVTLPKEAAVDLPPPTRIHAHNLSLRKGPDFRIYILWLNGLLLPAKKSVTPSLDDSSSFVLSVNTGVIHARMADISHYMNTGSAPPMPLQDISITGGKDRITVHGTVHKVPIELEGTVSVSPDSRILVHIDKLSVLKLPLKSVLGGFHVTVADLMPKGNPGIEAKGNDLYFDTQQLLPAPHIRGKLTSVHVASPDIVVMYGNRAQDDADLREEWRNFLALKGGTLVFGKLTMHDVDLIMVDASKDPWFDLDLVNYQAQLVYGYERMTPQAGLQIFMPDVDRIPKTPKAGLPPWIKNRNVAAPQVGLPAAH